MYPYGMNLGTIQWVVATIWRGFTWKMSKATFHNYDTKLPPQKTELEREKEQRVDSSKVEYITTKKIERLWLNLPKRKCRLRIGTGQQGQEKTMPRTWCHIFKYFYSFFSQIHIGFMKLTRVKTDFTTRNMSVDYLSVKSMHQNKIRTWTSTREESCMY